MPKPTCFRDWSASSCGSGILFACHCLSIPPSFARSAMIDRPFLWYVLPRFTTFWPVTMNCAYTGAWFPWATVHHCLNGENKVGLSCESNFGDFMYLKTGVFDTSTGVIEPLLQMTIHRWCTRFGRASRGSTSSVRSIYSYPSRKPRPRRQTRCTSAACNTPVSCGRLFRAHKYAQPCLQANYGLEFPLGVNLSWFFSWNTSWITWRASGESFPMLKSCVSRDTASGSRL